MRNVSIEHLIWPSKQTKGAEEERDFLLYNNGRL